MFPARHDNESIYQRKEEAMSQETPTESAPATEAIAKVESPPPAPMPPRDRDSQDEPRAKLLQLAAELMRSQNRRLVAEYLRLRRAIA
jgi:hypothetical protein